MTHKIVVSAGGTLVVGTGSAAGVAHYATREKVLIVVKDKVIPVVFDQESWVQPYHVWLRLYDLLVNSSETPRNHKLNVIKTENKGWNIFRDWCFSSYETTYKSIFVSEKEDLKSDVEKFCSAKISVFRGSRSLGDSATEAWKEAESRFKNINDGVYRNKEVKEIHKKVKELDNGSLNGDTLKGWCKDTSDRYLVDIELFSELDIICFFSIRSKIGSKFSKTNYSVATEPFKKHYDSLKSYTGSDPDVNSNADLKKIKEAANSDTKYEKLNEFQEWCDSEGYKAYPSESDNTFKLVKKFCSDQST